MSHAKNGRVLKVSRIEALTDGIFAIAMTILVLNVNLPTHTTIKTLSYNLYKDVIHQLFVYAGSFIILATYWVGMNFQLGFLARSTRLYLWINILFLLSICVVPFSASVLASFPHMPISIIFYATNLLCISTIQLIMWMYALHAGLNSEAAKIEGVSRSIYRRICVAPVFYAIAFLLAFHDTNLAFFILVAPPLIHIFPGAVDKLTDD
ncbi:MAG: TMEM175 family protein [Gammaproteobacteria bacterium]|nr:TMEM175 family protein [Gammaproteobacteria bacterium]